PDHVALPLPEPVPSAGPSHAAAHSSADTASTEVPARRAKPGPPARVAVPVLVLALLCFAVGIAALMAS
ncbi:serine/threonine protein kinase, partial [Streptomyces sp. NPDC088194]